MGLFRSAARKKPPTLDRETSLRAVPVLNPGVEIIDREDGGVCLRVRIPRQSTGWMARFLPPVFERNIQLDELGSFVVRQIDGRRTTRDIIDAFTAQYRLNRREAELSCTRFLRSLAERRAVSIAVL